MHEPLVDMQTLMHSCSWFLLVSLKYLQREGVAQIATQMLQTWPSSVLWTGSDIDKEWVYIYSLLAADDIKAFASKIIRESKVSKSSHDQLNLIRSRLLHEPLIY